jgi:predicted enzyme related to lactoylglutathione lyase
MTHVTRHAPGNFCWPELATSDLDAAKRFYVALFGWTFVDNDMGPELGVYTVLQLGGRDAAAAYKLMPGMMKAGVPPHWGSYIAVENVDESVKKAEGLGGKVLLPPCEAGENGRMAVLQDPTGAAFSLWQGRKSPGAAVIGEPGSLGWTQLNVHDTGTAREFYTGLFGWQGQEDPIPGGRTYTTWRQGEHMVGGMMPMPEAAGPAQWLVYFAVAGVEESHAQAISLGASSLVPPTPIPRDSQFAVLADPQGAPFAIVRFGA